MSITLSSLNSLNSLNSLLAISAVGENKEPSRFLGKALLIRLHSEAITSSYSP